MRMPFPLALVVQPQQRQLQSAGAVESLDAAVVDDSSITLAAVSAPIAVGCRQLLRICVLNTSGVWVFTVLLEEHSTRSMQFAAVERRQ
jgi:hypothetical protein